MCSSPAEISVLFSKWVISMLSMFRVKSSSETYELRNENKCTWICSDHRLSKKNRTVLFLIAFLFTNVRLCSAYWGSRETVSLSSLTFICMNYGEYAAFPSNCSPSQSVLTFVLMTHGEEAGQPFLRITPFKEWKAKGEN